MKKKNLSKIVSFRISEWLLFNAKWSFLVRFWVSKTSVFKMFGSETKAIIQVLWCYIKEPEALKSLYRSPGYKKNQLVLCKNYVLRWWPPWISDRHKKPKLFRGPSNDYSWTIWIQLSKWFKRRSVLKHFSHRVQC